VPADLNHVALVGRLTRDPELRYTAAGDPVCAMRLAVTSRARSGEGWEDRPNFLDVSAFGRSAEACAEHLRKGRRVAIAGRLAWREWQADDGSRREAVQIVAQAVQYLDAPRNDDGPAAVATSPKEAADGDASPG
jgi:single-strand DNA-binding protein